MARVYRSMSEFAGAIQQMGTNVDRAAIDGLVKTRRRMDAALDRERNRIGFLSRVGGPAGFGQRRGARVGHHSESTNLHTLLFKGGGPWSLVDNSVSGGPTAPHTITPDNRRNPRPLPPATRYKPTLRTTGGAFFGKEEHPGSVRRPYWANAIQSVQPTISKLMGREFDEAISRF